MVGDKYPVQNMQNLSAIFCKLDLCKGYFQIPMYQADIAKTDVIRRFGVWEYRRMPFGLKKMLGRLFSG
jgi:hypothetical protein